MTWRTKEKERILVEEAKSDPQAFSSLYNLYFQRIYSYVSWRIGSQRDIEEIRALMAMQHNDSEDKHRAIVDFQNRELGRVISRLRH